MLFLTDLLGKTGDDIELTSSPEAEETGSNRVEHEQTTLSLAEIASCSYEARYSNTFIYVSPGFIRSTTRKLYSVFIIGCVSFSGKLV